MIGEIANHLWQSTVFALAAGLLAIACRRNQARVRYWIWLSASVKFFVPFTLFISLGSQLEWPPAAQQLATPAVSSAVIQISEPFVDWTPATGPPAPSTPAGPGWFSLALLLLWMAGTVTVAQIRFLLWRRVRTLVAASTPGRVAGVPPGVDVRSAPGLMEPGVVGVWRPILLVPDGIADHLTPQQLDAVLAHELSHIRRRDNLTASIHMAAEMVFWFHPLVWWMGARLVEERERACDEEVLRRCGNPRVYAEAILNVCRRYAAAPLVCVSGVSGANLRKRIEAIMRNHIGRRPGAAAKIALAAAALTALAVPVAIGAMRPPALLAQSGQKFEVASVRRVEIPPTAQGNPVYPTTGGVGTSSPGRITYRATWLTGLIAEAFGVRPDQITGPAWLKTERYDIVANIPPGATNDDFKLMLADLLRDRFRLRFHMDSETRPIYALRIARNGPILKPTEQRTDDATAPAGAINGADAQGCPILPPGYQGMVGRPAPGEICWAARDVAMERLARLLEQPAARPVIDETSLTGGYDFTIRFEWLRRTPDAGVAADPAPTVFTAVEEQLGLKLEPATASFPRLIIDSIEREPTEN